MELVIWEVYIRYTPGSESPVEGYNCMIWGDLRDIFEPWFCLDNYINYIAWMNYGSFAHWSRIDIGVRLGPTKNTSFHPNTGIWPKTMAWIIKNNIDLRQRNASETKFDYTAKNGD